jgi:hypothetical protein
LKKKLILKKELKEERPQRKFGIPLEPPRGHLKDIPCHDSLQKVWNSGKGGYRFRTSDLKIGRRPQGKLLSPLEASHDHL